jgi:hypothetical protein
LSKSIDQRVEYSTPYEWEDYISTWRAVSDSINDRLLFFDCPLSL